MLARLAAASICVASICVALAVAAADPPPTFDATTLESLASEPSATESSLPDVSAPATLTLHDGSQLRGTVHPFTAPESLSWQSDDEEQPRAINWSELKSVRFATDEPNRSNLSPLQRQRLQAETRRKAALRGAWAPGQDDAAAGDSESTPAAWKNAIYLRGGDLISGRALSIESSAVRFESERFGEALFPDDQIAAVELADTAGLTSLDEETRRRLMTVPRAQLDEPPTHLIIALSGDYLRGRLLRLNERRIEFELATGQIEIPRERVGQIVWLPMRADGETPADESRGSEPTADESSVDTVQVVRDDGERLTLDVVRFDGRAISGTHPVLGECAVPVGQLAALLVGSTAEGATAEAEFKSWTLRAAPLPLADQKPSSD